MRPHPKSAGCFVRAASLTALACLFLPVIAKAADNNADPERVAGQPQRNPYQLVEQSGLRDPVALSEERGLYHWRAIWEGSDDLPQRPKLQWQMERSGDDAVKRRQLWTAGRGTGNRLRCPGDE